MQQRQTILANPARGASQPLHSNEARLVPGSRFHNKARILHFFVWAHPVLPTHKLWVSHLFLKAHHAWIRLGLESQESLNYTSCLWWHAYWAKPSYHKWRCCWVPAEGWESRGKKKGNLATSPQYPSFHLGLLKTAKAWHIRPINLYKKHLTALGSILDQVQEISGAFKVWNRGTW